ncbi:MAG: class I SAM-dependent methyltransferase [bacterium]
MFELSSDPYRNLASIYDQLGLSEKGESCARTILESLKELTSPGRMLDLGCGTGKPTILFALSGWDAAGLDLSQDMIAMARLQALEAQAKVDFTRHDMRTLNLENQFLLITCFATLNHFRQESELEAVIRMAARAIVKSGFLACDVFSPGAFPPGFTQVKIAPNLYLIERYSWQNEDLCERQLIWFRKKGELYEKKESLIEERAYSQAFFLETAEKYGLKLLKRWALKEEITEGEESPHSLFLFQKR